MPRKAECITLFHIITEGKCNFRTESGKSFLLQKGQVVIFPQSCSHVMCSNPDKNPVTLMRILNEEIINGLADLRYGGRGDKTRFICGYLLCDQRFNPLIGAVPEVIILTPEEMAGEFSSTLEKNSLPVDSVSILKGSWLELTLHQLEKEVKARNDGSATIITRLTELMYIEVLRHYMNNLPNNSRGWLAAVRDHEIGLALKHIHANPEKKWSVEELASIVNVSRSAFAERFTVLLGESPMKYLTGWRMQLAQRLLLQADLSLAMVAGKTGYESEISFNRAFKRYVGQPPATWRHAMLFPES
jgi:AraC-like DNA-binding protein